MPTSPSTFRIRPSYRRILDRLAKRRKQSPREIVELAIAHLDGTLAHGQPVYLEPAPPEPTSHKKAQRAS